MAIRSYTDKLGKQYPIDQYGNPQGYFENNEFLFPRFGNEQPFSSGSVQFNPFVADPYKLPQKSQNPLYEVSGDNSFDDQGQEVSPNTGMNNANTMGRVGTGLGILSGVPGLGIALGAIGTGIDVGNANAAATNSFGTPPGEVSFGSAFANAMSFGMFGESSAGQVSAIGAEMSSVPDGEISSADDDIGMDSPEMGGNNPGVDAKGNATGQDIGSDGGGDDKIICTAMNKAYGFGSFRQAIWLQQSKNLRPEYQKGYHIIGKPLIRFAYSKDTIARKALRNSMEYLARRRTADIWQQRRGKRDFIGASWRMFIEPLCFVIGRCSK